MELINKVKSKCFLRDYYYNLENILKTNEYCFNNTKEEEYSLFDFLFNETWRILNEDKYEILIKIKNDEDISNIKIKQIKLFYEKDHIE